MPKLQEFVVTLKRQKANIPWGIRLVGGSDLETPLIITKVQLGSPAQGDVVRGDVITKIGDYDCRDIRHEDAEMLFKTSGNEIKLVVRRDNRIYGQPLSNGTSRCSSTVPSKSPIRNTLSPMPQGNLPYRAPSPLPPGSNSYKYALSSPVNTLPHTVFPYINESGGYYVPPRPPSSTCFSPMPTRDYLQDQEDEASAILNQPYRTTPLILPGAKVKKDNLPTESYLRHHPNPAMRAGPSAYDYQDVLMKQKVADSVLHRVIGGDNDKVVHKQFNSPIGLYSDRNIENTIKQTVPLDGTDNQHMPSKIEGYKKTVVYDPSKSETYRALQEDNYVGDYVQEVPIPVQHKVFHPNRMIAGKKPSSSFPPPNPQHVHYVNSLGDSVDNIHQSGSFKRLMYSVLGETNY